MESISIAISTRRSGFLLHIDVENWQTLDVWLVNSSSWQALTFRLTDSASEFCVLEYRCLVEEDNRAPALDTVYWAGGFRRRNVAVVRRHNVAVKI